MSDGAGPVRACRPDELPALLDEANRIFRPRGGDLGRDLPLLFAASNADNLRVVADRDGRIVAHAGLCLRDAILGDAAGRARVGCLGVVFTREDARGRGWGSLVVADALARGRAAGAALALISGNRGLYRRAGFATLEPAIAWRPPEARSAGSSRAEPGERAADGSTVGAFAVSAFAPGDAGALAALHEAEPVRFVRSGADWAALLGASMLGAWPARIWIVRRDGRAVAYLAVQERRRGGDDRAQLGRVMEHAGARDAVLAAAPLVSAEIVAPAHDLALARHARARGWSPAPLPLALSARWLAARPDAPPLPSYGLDYV